MFSRLRFCSKLPLENSIKLSYLHRNHLYNIHICPVSSISTKSTSFAYKNRYDHFRTCDRDDPFPFFYKCWIFFISGLVVLFMSGHGFTVIDNIETWIENKKLENEKTKTKDAGPFKAKCETIGDITHKGDANISNPISYLKSWFSSESKPKKVDSGGDGQGNPADEQPKKKAGFRDRKFIAYEDRIRAFSTPDKIFRYFATIRTVDDENLSGEIYMTPDDFLRAISPGIKQPDGLALDSYNRYDPKTGLMWNKTQKKTEKLNLQISKDSVFYALGDKALISFSDFIFLLTVLSTPPRQFEIAFRMFDLNGDGELDVDEFEVVRSVVMDTTALGKRHRDHSTTGSTLRPVASNSALKHYFFGPKGDKKLTIGKFLDFQHKLESEIMRLEFDRFDQTDGKISELSFAKSLLTYAGFQDNKRRKMFKRIRTCYSDPENCQGITFEQFMDFHKFLKCISDVDTALTFYHMAGASIDPTTLSHVAQAVANVHIAPHIVQVVFRLFDENDDGHLSNREFVSVMKNRLLRGLDRPMDTGFIRFLSALANCSYDQSKLIFSDNESLEQEESWDHGNSSSND